jgi:hypothetical protein
MPPFGTATVVTNVGKGITAKRFLGASPTQAEPKFLALGVGATGAARTAAAADTALSTEVETRVGTNAGTTVTTTNTNDTYQVIQTITATANRAVDEAALFDASSAGSMFVSATFPVVSLLTGDSVQITAKVQYT